ncbi:MAG TPA: UvrD-helicase domain-containing protein [Deltaproteobacteria bacterium]|nr:UvrD-helicase domain-containing protein [Deltaproteobacteria bacterium]HPP79803.1 UvrD-helicase domain-containing protein [Deltaproteobacteria bacterium]
MNHGKRTSRLLDGLNEEQARAVLHTEGPLLVFAGAGSGKTRVIVHRVAYLVECGAEPSGILCLTFTNKAAQELKERIRQLLGAESIPVWAGTFHAFGAWMLRREAHRIGFPPSFAIYDEADQRSLLSRCLKEIGVEKTRGLVGRLAWLVNMSKDTMRPVHSFPFEYTIDPQTVLSLYEEKKKASSAFDFADLISVPVGMLATDDMLRNKYRARFSHILVDEYQDTNTAQYRLLMELVGPSRNICVVGDDDQSIYGWRGADVGNILRFRDDFPDAEVVVLERNYRSSEEILKAASTLIANNTVRAPKTLRAARGAGSEVVVVEAQDDSEEADLIAYQVMLLLDGGASPTDIAVFYRVNALSRTLEEAFVRRSIPYAVYGGIRFYERREVKDLLSFLRVAANPGDEEALLRIVNVPPRGIGDRALHVIREIAGSEGLSLMEAMQAARARKTLKGAARKGLEAFCSLMEDLQRNIHGMDIAGMLLYLIDKTGYRDYLLQETDGVDRVLNVQELVSSAQGQNDLVSYLQEKALLTTADAAQGTKAVSLMTLHMSKGLEFDHVFIAGCEEGLLPHALSCEDSSQVEEERRLLYVGMTRARRRLVLSWARVRGIYGRQTYQVPSGFLQEIEAG